MSSPEHFFRRANFPVAMKTVGPQLPTRAKRRPRNSTLKHFALAWQQQPREILHIYLSPGRQSCRTNHQNPPPDSAFHSASQQGGAGGNYRTLGTFTACGSVWRFCKTDVRPCASRTWRSRLGESWAALWLAGGSGTVEATTCWAWGKTGTQQRKKTKKFLFFS